MEAAKHVAGFLGGTATQVSEGKESGEDQYSKAPYPIQENGITKVVMVVMSEEGDRRC